MEITNIAAEIFNNEDSLISTKIDEIRLVRDNVDELEILIRISGFSQKSRFSKINLLFKDIVEFGFYFNESYTFYNIENYKLLNLNNCIYISFDPDDNIGKSENDSDFIFAKHVNLTTEI